MINIHYDKPQHLVVNIVLLQSSIKAATPGQVSVMKKIGDPYIW